MDVSVEDVAGVPWQFLRNSAYFSLYRAKLESNSQTVLIASAKEDNPNPENIKQLVHESSLSPELESSWAARPLTLLNMAGRTICVLEDFGGSPLQQMLASHDDRLADWGYRLRIAANLAAGLAELHKRGLIHRDLNPANILVDEIGAVRITGFGLAVHRDDRPENARRTDEPVGSYPYMPPEQTGLMSRPADERSDLYSLGVTFYELFYGALRSKRIRRPSGSTARWRGNQRRPAMASTPRRCFGTSPQSSSRRTRRGVTKPPPGWRLTSGTAFIIGRSSVRSSGSLCVLAISSGACRSRNVFMAVTANWKNCAPPLKMLQLARGPSW
jgi:serine/threonine protein kinase